MPMPTPVMTGTWKHNSYVVKPTPPQVAAPTIPPPPKPIVTDATKWAKGTFIITPGSKSQGKLVFVPGALELSVDFSLEDIDGQTVFRAQGVGTSGPLSGAVYNLLGWAKLDAAGNVTEVAGGILGVSGSPAGLGGEAPGTAGYFKLEP